MTPKILLIGIDGVEYTRFAKFFETPHHWHYHKAYTGGIVGEPSEASTMSGPGWASIMTGVWADQHGVLANYTSQRSSPRHPWVLRMLKDYNPQLQVNSTVTWPPIHRFFTDQFSGISAKEFNSANLAADNEAVKFTKSYIEVGADVNFVQLSWPDYAAHRHGYGPIYDKSLETAFAHMEELRLAVEARQRDFPQERWLILATTDHGRTASGGSGHGGNSASEKTVFIASNLPPNAELTDPVPIAGLDPLYAHAAHTAIVPTILRHMGALQAADAMRLDSIPLIGDLGLRKVRVDRKNKRLTWHSEKTAEVPIYKNGVLVEYQRADTQRWEHPSIASGFNHFTLQQNATLASAGMHQMPRSLLGWAGSNTMFFFNDGTYSLINLNTKEVLSGYPKPINETTWKGISRYQAQIVATLRWKEDSMFIFSDSTYIRFSRSADAAAHGARNITESTWPGLGAHAAKIKTALNWKDGKIHFFLTNNTYIRYDIEADKADSGYPKPIDDKTWPGLAPRIDQLIAAVRRDDKNTAYFFFDDRTYLEYDMDQDQMLPGPPKPFGPPEWQGLA